VFPHREYARERIAQHAARLGVFGEPVSLTLELAGPVRRGDGPGAYRPVELGERLGPLFATYWLRAIGPVPEHAHLFLDFGGEATLWRDGTPVEALSSGPRQARLSVPVPRPAGWSPLRSPAGEQVFELELACNDPFGYGESGQGQAMRFELRRCHVAARDDAAWRTFHDLDFLLALEAVAEPEWAGELLARLHDFTIDGDRAHLDRLLARRSGALHHTSAIGHGHLDTAWLWPLEETYRKLIRTTTAQLRLLDDYPDHVFAHSQAQHYAWLRDRAPQLYARVREAVAAGRWIPVGGTWIEPDCNLPSGESLARQFLYGQRFFTRELGRRCTEFWNPDVFGYTAQLPQLMREAQITRFLTQKLSWNRFNQPEHHTFTWQGLDGSEVLTHFPPADTYNAEATVEELWRESAGYRDHGRSHHSLLVFGHGDGGGGPTDAMLERLARARDIHGLAPTTIRSPVEFFDALEADASDLRTVVGELYFELHRGTYTTQAQVKRGNRRAEGALHDAELLAALAGGEYPRAELTRLWETLLLNQFHDILPGSSIREVNVRAAADLAAVEAGADAISAGVLGRGDVPFNTRAFARREVVELDGELVVADVPPCGAGTIVRGGEGVRVTRRADGSVELANEHLRAVIAPDGTVTSLVAAGREALSAPANRFELYEDLPTAWDAWDVDPAHLETREDVPPASGIDEIDEHPLRAEVVFERGWIAQRIRLDAGSRRLEFVTDVDWRLDHRFLKVAFPLAVHAPEATYEVAFGAVRRPTHYSTRADLARYEVPGHRWADLSEHGFGVAVLTDAKYGYSAFADTLRISLLRAPRSPDPEADKGPHAFTYALLPHAGSWQDAGVVDEAIALNSPIRFGALAPGSLASVSGGLVLDTVKRAEDSGALVLRLYDPHGARGVSRIRVPRMSACRANLLEEPGEPLETDGDDFLVPFRPWEIITLTVV
jgi:alpha-mannosidase